MLHIILKDFYQSKKVLLFSLIIGVFFITSLTSSNGESIMMGGFILMLTFSVVVTNEHYEDKHKGYYLLRTLPIKGYKIIIGKFISSFLIIAMGVGVTLLILILNPKISQVSTFTTITIMNGVSMTLTFIGIFYVMQYKWGAGIAINVSRVVFFLAFFSPTIIDLLMEKLKVYWNFMEMLRNMDIINGYILLSLSFTVYLICMVTSISVYKKNYFV